MEFRIIKSPSEGTIDILRRRMGNNCKTDLNIADAVGLVQGRMIEMIYAADIAEKAVGVTVEDIRGSCPQNMILIAIFGDTASVESAINEIKMKMEEGKAL
ncbi:BMC domain-containing protein [Clostridium chauvoei]|uniref:BMC domain-containing protein n=2 Tax=Clostridium chauvoei TaxID=46867 RepID=A0ABD4RGG2_9CLOT|nr:BMC domain-containing protein [Clostridium chauvoei]ATD55739.1 BMC domain protein [Clostridium chauvoei]MBX7280284.1 BMC domain-containing protein [Clostridium chauvoei]MBX7282769.1 BMC domain-containing protein [Clostridium chauvoei]MBX7285175.1 BMC domain-containing protein [Clostridium chauvoei]MBX7287708.1 BMC domain-containing protein [Clostridium chauvoei]